MKARNIYEYWKRYQFVTIFNYFNEFFDVQNSRYKILFRSQSYKKNAVLFRIKFIVNMLVNCLSDFMIRQEYIFINNSICSLNYQ